MYCTDIKPANYRATGVSLSEPSNISASKPAWQGMFSALSVRIYRLYWLSTFVSFFGGQMQQPAQAWLAFELTHSPLKLTLVMAMQAIPMVFISLFSGVINDRFQKRNMIIITQTSNVVFNLIIATLIATGNIQYWHLLASSFLSGVAGAFNMPARNSIIAELVPRERIYNAIALNNAGGNVAAIGGPALAGVLIATIGTAGTYYIGITFNIAAIIITAFLPATSKLGTSVQQSFKRNLTEGLKYLRLHNFLLLLIGMELVITLFGFSYQGLIPIFADLLGQQSEGYGFMLAAIGIGSLIGSLGLASLGNFKRKWLILAVAGVGVGIVLVLFSNSHRLSDILHMNSGVYIISMFLLILLGIFSTSYTSTSNSIVQISTSEEYRGRMNSIYGMIIGFYPLSTLGVGAMADYIGAPMSLTITGSILAVIMLMIALFNRKLRRME